MIIFSEGNFFEFEGKYEAEDIREFLDKHTLPPTTEFTT